MPGFIGRRLCPELLFVKPNFQKYTRAAAASRAVFGLFDPDFEAGSLDEAYLDITDYCRAHEITGREHLLSIPSLPNPIWITQPLSYPVSCIHAISYLVPTVPLLYTLYASLPTLCIMHSMCIASMK